MPAFLRHQQRSRQLEEGPRLAIPLIVHVQFASPALPIVAALTVQDRPRPVLYHRAIVWLCVLMLTDESAMVVGKLAGNNLWLGYLTLPVEVALFLWMSSVLQPTEYLRTAYSLAIPVIGTIVVALMTLTDPAQTFDRFIAPALALVALTASLQTLVLRSLESRTPLTQQDWFWLCLGLSLFWLSFVSITIFHQTFIGAHSEWVVTALIARSWVDIAAYLLMAWGLLQPWLQARSFGSS
jgi:hypothetical protein